MAFEPGISADLSTLRGLADGHGNVSADTLYSATGVSEGFLSGLERQLFEQKLGAGPWPLVQLESILAESRVKKVTQSASFVAAPPAPPGAQKASFVAAPPAPPESQEAPTLPIIEIKDKLQDSPQQPKRPSFFRCLPELVQLERLVLDALAVEDAGSVDEIEEPESEHPTMECSLSRLERATEACINAPALLRQGPCGEQEEGAARRMLPALLQDAIGMLKKTWRLAHVRGQHIQHLVEGAQLTSGQEHSNVVAQTIESPGKNTGRLGAPADVASMKKVLKEKDWELAHARQRNEQLEEERASLESRLLHMERSKQREAWSRGESERRLAELQSECSRSSEQRNDLRRRLAAAKIALGQAHEALNEARRELGSAERRREEARLSGDWRAAELESELMASKRAVEELRLQLQQQTPSVTDAASAGGHELGWQQVAASRLAEQQQQEQQQQLLEQEQPQQQPPQIASPSNAGSASTWPSRPRASTLEVVKEEDGVHGDESDPDSSCSSEDGHHIPKARFGNGKVSPRCPPWVPTVPPLALPPPPGETQQQAAATATPPRQAVVAQSASVPPPVAHVQQRISLGPSSHNSSRAGSPTPGHPNHPAVTRPMHAVQQRMCQVRAGGSASWSPAPAPRSPKDSMTVSLEKQIGFSSPH